MHVVVVGAGLIGVTTAYHLRRAGHRVTLLEQGPQPGLQTSFANGGMLTPSMADPWNAPGVWKDVLRWMGKSDAPMLLRPRALPRIMGWGLRFLAASSPERFAANTQRNLRLAVFSVAGMQTLRDEESLDYHASTRGTVKIYRNAAAFDAGIRKMQAADCPAVRAYPLSAQELIELEPALAPIASRLAGGVHFASDESGDAHLFTAQLWSAAQQRGVHAIVNSSVLQVVVDKGRVIGVHTSDDVIPADAVVVAAGCDTPRLMRPLGVAMPIQPVKGYSLTCTAPASTGEPRLGIPIVDDDLHAAVTPLGDTIRIAGTAEFTGFDRSLDPARIENLQGLLHEVLPTQAPQLLANEPRAWAGLRPMSADGVPCIGSCGIDGLYVNAGHGHLGWTMADGSARLLVDIIDGRRPAGDIDPKDYDPQRWLRRRRVPTA